MAAFAAAAVGAARARHWPLPRRQRGHPQRSQPLLASAARSPPSVLAPHSHHLHPTTAPSTGQYLGGPNNQPIYFAGTDPRQPGFPPPEDENDVGTPRDQWELALGPLDLYDLLGPNHF